MSRNPRWLLFSQANLIRLQRRLTFPMDILQLLRATHPRPQVTLLLRHHIRLPRQIIPQLRRLTARLVLATPRPRLAILLLRLLTAQLPPAIRRLVLVTPLPLLHILLLLPVILRHLLPTVRHHQATHQHLHPTVLLLQVTHQVVLATGNQFS